MVRCDVIGRLAHRGARGQHPNDVTQQSAQNVNKSPGVATSYIRPCAARPAGYSAGPCDLAGQVLGLFLW